MFHQHFQILSIDIITTLLRDDSDTSYAISHLKFPAPPWHIVLFSLCGRDSIFVLNVGSRLYFTREMTLLIINISVNFFGSKNPWDDFLQLSKQLMKIFVKISVFVYIEAMCTRTHHQWTKSNFGPIWMRNGPKILKIFMATLNPFCDRIESIKLAGKRCSKVASKTCWGRFLERIIVCRICGLKNDIWLVNSLGTSLYRLLVLNVC